MRENYQLIDITPDLLPLKAVREKKHNARLVQICAVNTKDGFDLLYSFAKEYRFITYKVQVDIKDEVVTISDIYPSAALYENEMKELFGVKIKYINLDYKRKLYTIDAETPFRPEADMDDSDEEDDE